MASQSEIRGMKGDLEWVQGVALITLQGEVDAFAEPALTSVYERAEAGSPRAVLLNLEAVGYINSTGIALLVELLARARKSQLPLMICGLSDHYREIFRITRLSDFMTIYDDVSGALSALSPEIS